MMFETNTIKRRWINLERDRDFYKKEYLRLEDQVEDLKSKVIA